MIPEDDNLALLTEMGNSLSGYITRWWLGVTSEEVGHLEHALMSLRSREAAHKKALRAGGEAQENG